MSAKGDVNEESRLLPTTTILYGAAVLTPNQLEVAPLPVSVVGDVVVPLRAVRLHLLHHHRWYYNKS
jgi:hypothetical protein